MSDRATKATVTGRFIGGGLFQPRANENDPERTRYSACVVLDEGQDKKIEKIVQQAISDRWGGKKPAGLQNWGVREGDDPEYEASFEQKFINPKSTRQPQTLVRQGDIYVATTMEDGVIYPGCYIGVSVEAYGYESDKKKGIKPGVSLNLRAVLFRADGERLDDYLDAASEFSDVEVESSEDDEDFLAA